MPARELTFTTKNILSAWEAAGAIPVNPRRVLKSETRKNSKGVSLPVPSQPSTSCRVPKTPRAVSRDTRSAIALISRNTPSSKKLKALLSGLSEGFQQAISDRVLEEESHQQYRELVGKGQRIKTSDRRKLTEATVVTTETVLSLRENRERLDAEKGARKARKLTKLLDSLSLTSKPPKSPPKNKKKRVPPTKEVPQTTNSGEESTDWEEGNDSDGSIYQGPSQVAPTSTVGRVGKEGLGLQGPLPEEDGNVFQTVRRSSRFL